MPGRKSFGPAGKWVHDRANRLLRGGDLKERYGEKRGKQIAYAIGVQQAHKVGKSPKGFRTAQGMRTAKAKMTSPVKEYRKTASLAAFFDELQKISAMGMDLRRLGEAGVKRPAFPTEGSKSFANKQFSQSRKIGQSAAVQPPKPNIRAVASMPR